ncbi:bifunctional murein DD-endopeptidase/murein LD-carboxypeptidase [Halomonas cibimaris]|uniref:Bifunctional murein DD-endopeptidase/murein LD-carboxypeptidase n=1 Tax=Halomonas cibimaris TaxID=657012 RepID=A0ABP7LGR5_9GAMM
MAVVSCYFSGVVRYACALALAVILAGCASSGGAGGEPPGDDFASSLPGVPGDDEALMSPVDNPVTQLSRLRNPPPLVIRRALLKQHKRWSGTPYRLGGTTQRGIDCSALVQNVYQDTFAVSLPRTTRGLVNKGHAIKRRHLRAGDLVFFRPPGSRHVGIYVGDGYFLHASVSQGVTISALDNTYWQRYYWQSRRTLERPQMARLSRVL